MQESPSAAAPETGAKVFTPEWLRGVREFNRQMFPVFPNGAVLFAQFALNYVLVARVLLPEPQAPEWQALVFGGLSSVLFTYLLRVFDEIKDYHSDHVNFPDRPLVRGPLGLRGARHLWGAVVVLLVLLQLPFVARPVLVGFLIVVAYSFLSFKWFFMEDEIRTSLPKALLTHNPIVYLYQLYLLSFFGLPFLTVGLLPATLFVIGDTMAWTGWEIARKIRGTEEETAYTTYSKIWGPTAATLLVVLLLAGSWAVTMTTVRAALRSNLVLLFWIPPALVLAFTLFKALGYIRDPRKAPPFRTLVESFKIATFAAVTLTLTLGIE
jgi:4-hydroxybenzoate polyprenyltransferase